MSLHRGELDLESPKPYKSATQPLKGLKSPRKNNSKILLKNKYKKHSRLNNTFEREFSQTFVKPPSFQTSKFNAFNQEPENYIMVNISNAKIEILPQLLPKVEILHHKVTYRCSSWFCCCSKYLGNVKYMTYFHWTQVIHDILLMIIYAGILALEIYFYQEGLGELTNDKNLKNKKLSKIERQRLEVSLGVSGIVLLFIFMSILLNCQAYCALKKKNPRSGTKDIYLTSTSLGMFSSLVSVATFSIAGAFFLLLAIWLKNVNDDVTRSLSRFKTHETVLVILGFFLLFLALYPFSLLTHSFINREAIKELKEDFEAEFKNKERIEMEMRRRKTKSGIIKKKSQKRVRTVSSDDEIGSEKRIPIEFSEDDEEEKKFD